MTPSHSMDIALKFDAVMKEGVLSGQPKSKPFREVISTVQIPTVTSTLQ